MYIQKIYLIWRFISAGLIRQIEDYRKHPDYELSEIIMGAISMFLFEKESRNAYNNERINSVFASNYKKLFNFSLLHMETVEGAFRKTSHNKKHCDKCLTKTYQSGKKRYFHNVLEAKLVLPNGLSILLASEWIENPGKDYDQQDCELK